MAKKEYANFMVFGARIYGMKNLWQPSTEFQGKPVTKPNYLAGFIVPKTAGHWSQEPLLANLWAAMQKIHAASLSALDYNTPNLWPIRDGDMPQDPQKPAPDWAKGHWMFSGNSGDPIKVELTQGQSVVPLQARGNIVKPGDFVIVGGAASINSQSNRSIKLYINNVVFTAQGEEIAIGNSVSGAELMAAAAAQGYRPTGFNASPASGGGFGGAPQGGFAPPNGGGFGGAPQGGFQQGGGFAPGNPPGSPGPNQNHAAPGFAAPGHGGTPSAPNGNATFPSNAAPQGPGFGQSTPFPGR